MSPSERNLLGEQAGAVRTARKDSTELERVDRDRFAPEAFDKLRERAAAIGQSIEDTALDVLDGVIRFDQ